ncbi:ATP-binding protein [Actinospica sp. MGRD01-02]|uniref:ATP-binding protein n=1 Tax=Actinospica acidithermotolerans TaxID=2828514 RepID=A0A941EA66_9ACTN|nr:ATP-binding protein [Actinospica acidithermotolerans]MBR7827811.1 ATP-binding protein [Actinospica acidithermotolerans]
MSGPTIQDRRRASARIYDAASGRASTVPVRRLGFSFAAEPVHVAQARHRVADLLGSAWGDGPAAEEATLVASEVLTNGCRYGGGRVRVRARISSQRMTLKVSTPAPWRDPEAQPDVDAESGRGLEIVRALAESVSIAADPDGLGVSVTVVCLAAPAPTAAAMRSGAR